jgi:hypothetical protein
MHEKTPLHKRSQLGRKKGLFLKDGIHSPDQVLACVRFCYISLHANFLSFVHELPALVHGENNNRCFRREPPDHPSCVQAVQFWHCNVQNDQVRFQLPGFFDGFSSIWRFRAHLESNLRNED